MLTSCGVKKNKRAVFVSHVDNNQEDLKEDAFLKLAKFSDINLPVGYEFIDFKTTGTNCSNELQQGTDFFCYKGAFSVTDATVLFKYSMERNGWDITDFSNEQEGLIICDKVNKNCAISIRSDIDKDVSFIRLFIREKKYETNTKDAQNINSKSILFKSFVEET